MSGFVPCDMDDELRVLIKSNHKLIYVVTPEEERVVRSLLDMCDRDDTSVSKVVSWDVAEGLHEMSYNKGKVSKKKTNGDMNDLVDVLDYIGGETEDLAKDIRKTKKGEERPKSKLYLLCDAFRFLEDGYNLDPVLERKLRGVSKKMRATNSAVIIVSPVLNLPTALQKEITVIDYPLPSRDQMHGLLNRAKTGAAGRDDSSKLDLSDPPDDRIVDALMGLTLIEADDALAKALVKKRKFDISVLNSIKRQVIRKGGLLDYLDVDEEMSALGGFDGVKEFVSSRACAFTDEAKKYGLTKPKGVLLMGIPGTGKSLAAKAIASDLELPLLKLDMGSMFDSLVGESEKNMRSALKLAEAVAPCVLLTDEIDKGLSGGDSDSRSGDSGTTKRVVGSLLNWMQKDTGVFVVACANSLSGIPTEMLRKGRFDELFFVDLPKVGERRQIIEIHISKRGRDPKKFDIDELCDETNKFVGSEIENAIEQAMFIAYNDGGREFETRDIVKACRNIRPLSEVMKEQIDSIREEAEGKMRKASSPMYDDEEDDEEEGISRFATMD